MSPVRYQPSQNASGGGVVGQVAGHRRSDAHLDLTVLAGGSGSPVSSDTMRTLDARHRPADGVEPRAVERVARDDRHSLAP